jgi:signal peptidase I
MSFRADPEGPTDDDPDRPAPTNRDEPFPDPFASRGDPEPASDHALNEADVDGGKGGGSVATATEAPAKARKPPQKGFVAFLTELPVLLLIAFVLALLIKSFLVQAFYIPSESMVPTLKVGDRVLVNKLVYRFHPPRRGDIIVFQDPNPPPQPHRNALDAFWHWLTEGLGFAQSPEKDFIKRVIALPGETIEIRTGGAVYIDGKLLDEPYLQGLPVDPRPFGIKTVPPGMLFVMGDNRPDSNDSRFGLGFVPINKVIGKAFVKIWPPSRIGLLHGS